VIVQKDKIIDISETTIGNDGAKFVAEAIPECAGLEEIRLSNCGIKDEGALAIFEQIRHSSTVNMLDLGRNQLTEKCFDGLIQMLQVNKVI
jgi:Ran GTPase-activating protein (RanGAP) involved in mRNA processing and transport